MDNKHGMKMIAPIVISVLFLGFLALYIYLVFFTAAMTTPVLLVLAIPLAALGGAMVWTLVTRIREIDKGEEDDLSNY